MRNRHRGGVAIALATVSMALGWGCSTSEDRLGVEVQNEPGPVFTDFDSGPDVEAGLVSYCPSNRCPAGRTTCPNSRFPCDVDLLTDPDNCGACGFACPTGSATETFVCQDGTCVMQCEAFMGRLDCDGLADNGCELMASTNFNCGACGRRCTDPEKSCAYQSGISGSGPVDCGCPAGKTACNAMCVDTTSSDFDCGACNTTCDPTGGGAPSFANAYYGCMNSECGHLKCRAYHANCDQDESNGCETSLVSDDDCGACGYACPDGQFCRLTSDTLQPRCMCPEGTTYCERGCNADGCIGECVNLTADRNNCGACGVVCANAGLTNASLTCDYGMCEMRCREGNADCNSSASDGCEVDTSSDPRNCGGCGHACDAVAGQACVAGRCVIEPCGDDGGLTR